MRRMGGTVIAAVAAFVLCAGCGTVLINSDVERRGDGWTMTLQRLSDGPNQVQPSGYTVYSAPSGSRLLHAYFKFKNDSGQPRVFGYDSCDMDLKGDKVLPGMVFRYNGIMSEMDRAETYDAGETNYRHLAFVYPDGPLPTRIQCGSLTFAVPGGPAASAGR
jgi:hypothetical protein